MGEGEGPKQKKGGRKTKDNKTRESKLGMKREREKPTGKHSRFVSSTTSLWGIMCFPQKKKETTEKALLRFH